MRLIIDLRCLQDPDYAERGIGNHARGLVTRAPAPFIGIIDPRLPPLPADIAGLAAELSPHAYLPNLPPGTVFLNPSPMGPDQIFIARLLCDPRITKAACVHDFIPHDAPATYLTTSATRLDYLTSLAWLRRYDLFFPVSESTATRLRGLFGPVRAHVTGAALPRWAETIPPAPPEHILMIGGGDPRKNPETLRAAHDSSAALRRIPLVITQRVTTAELRSLYARAYCVVVPSRAEGFSLPVIEAMAAGVPVLVSDIPAHRELVPDAAARFAPDDINRLARLLEEVVAARRPGPSDIWRRFTGDAVATRLWSHLATPAPAVLRGAKPRIAMLTPLPPAKSGVADYAAALAPDLGRLAELTLFTEAAVSPLPHLSPRFDAVVSVMGNAPFHDRIYDLALRHGSAVICHDSRLLGLMAWRNRAQAAAMASDELGRAVTPAEIDTWVNDETKRQANFLGGLARAARPLMFHAPPTLAEVAARFGVAARHLPFAMQRVFTHPGAGREAARAALGIAPAEKIIASFGFVGRNKGIEAALHAFARLRTKARLVFVGEETTLTPRYRALAERLGIADAVVFGTDFVSESVYCNHLLAADCGLQLREGGLGNISGALADCIAAGLPSVATRDLAENIAAPSYVRRVSDTLDVAEIADALEATLEAPRNTEPERAAHCETFSMARYAQKLLDMLEP
jgi:glycosyltransferase involved in cell wall biosynthesis